MDGISIGRDRTGSGSRAQGTLTDFEEFFAPLYPRLLEYSWLVDGALFSFPDDHTARFARDVLARDGECRYFRSGSLERWARYLVDDWCTLLGFRAIADDPRALVKSARDQLSDAGISALDPAPECVFHCVDGARWTFYARDVGLLTIVREHVAAHEGLRMWNLRLGDDVT